MESNDLTDPQLTLSLIKRHKITSSNIPSLEKINNLQKEFAESRSEVKEIANTINKIL